MIFSTIIDFSQYDVSYHVSNDVFYKIEGLTDNDEQRFVRNVIGDLIKSLQFYDVGDFEDKYTNDVLKSLRLSGEQADLQMSLRCEVAFKSEITPELEEEVKSFIKHVIDFETENNVSSSMEITDEYDNTHYVEYEVKLVPDDFKITLKKS